MASQFDMVMASLRVIRQEIQELQSLVLGLRSRIGNFDEDSFKRGVQSQTEILEDVLFPEKETRSDILYGQQEGGENPIRAGSPRSVVEYRTVNGETETIPVSELDQKIQEVLRIAIQFEDPWQLYQDVNGVIRIAVSNEVLTRYHKQTTPQPRMKEGE